MSKGSGSDNDAELVHHLEATVSSLRQEVKILKESIDKVDEANREGLWLCFISIVVLVSVCKFVCKLNTYTVHSKRALQVVRLYRGGNYFKVMQVNSLP